HGSRSLDPAFLAAVRPRLAVVSVGARNSFGLPAPETVAALEQLGAGVRRTDRDGAVVVHVTRSGWWVETGRPRRRRVPWEKEKRGGRVELEGRGAGGRTAWRAEISEGR
ncbi:MAG: MBL fold metallo-hydrolase, partial [Firmicutes bacterium]|nr:MBL fold metallo-hydrolase [Bacillota bacterium]